MIYPQLFIGIDVSKLKHDVAIFNEQKEPIHKVLVIGENLKGYQALVSKLEQLKQRYRTQKFIIGLEATSDYWKNLYAFLKKQSQAYVLTLLNPVQTKKFAEAELRRAKTDPVNAKDIACFMVEKRPKPSFDRPPVFDIIKDIDRQIYSFKKQQTMTVNKLRIELDKVAPEIEHASRTISGHRILALLQIYPTAEDIANATSDELRQVRYGKKQWPLPKNFITRMKILAQDSIAYKTGPGAGIVVQTLVKRIVEYQLATDALKNKIGELYQTVNERKSLLTTIKGISEEMAITLEAYIGDANRFSNAKKVVAYFGMNPTVRQSGKSTGRNSYLQKKGNGLVRHKLFMAVLNMIRYKIEPFYGYYIRLVDAGKPKLVAVVATMRKLLVICYTILKTQTPFDINKT